MLLKKEPDEVKALKEQLDLQSMIIETCSELSETGRENSKTSHVDQNYSKLR